MKNRVEFPRRGPWPEAQLSELRKDPMPKHPTQPKLQPAEVDRLIDRAAVSPDPNAITADELRHLRESAIMSGDEPDTLEELQARVEKLRAEAQAIERGILAPAPKGRTRR
jgi:hypothetical protein